MKLMACVWLSLVILWLTACAPNASAPTTVSTNNVVTPSEIPVVTPTRSGGLPLTITVAVMATLPPATATQPVDTATPTPIEPSPTRSATSRPTAVTAAATATLPNCPPPPTPAAVETQAAVQHFEHGLMFWLQSRNEIWVLIESPTADQFYWRVLPNLWSVSQPESDPAIQPPPGKFQPVRGFGLAWRLGGGSVSPQRSDLGWALDEETGFTTSLLYYPQGFYSPDCKWMPKSGIYEMKDDRGTVIQFVGAGGIAKISTGN